MGDLRATQKFTTSQIDFLIKTLKNAKVHSVLECLGIRIVKENYEGSTLGEKGAETQDKAYVRRKRLAESGSPR